MILLVECIRHPQVLRGMAEWEDEEVRLAVAAHPLTPVEALEVLSRDRSEQVREEVAACPSLPVEVLERLAEDSSPWVSVSEIAATFRK